MISWKKSYLFTFPSLTELEIQMKLSLKQQIEDAMKTYDDMTITESVNRYLNFVFLKKSKISERFLVNFTT